MRMDVRFVNHVEILSADSMAIDSVRQKIKELCDKNSIDYSSLKFTVIVDVDHHVDHVELRPQDEHTSKVFDSLEVWKNFN